MKHFRPFFLYVLLGAIASAVGQQAAAQTTWAKVAVGDLHTVALKSNGTVWAWGYNGNGQLGDNSTTQRNTPVQVKGAGGTGFLTGITAIAAGNNYTVALKNDGTVWAWGYNGYGQLGNDATTGSSTPVQVVGADGTGTLTGITAITAGAQHTVALKSDGTVWAWGANSFGQLGDNATANQSIPVQVIAADGNGTLTGITAITAGAQYTVALKSDGTILTWGYNGFGQLGDNTVTNSSLPLQVYGAGGSGNLANITTIAAGGNHTIAIKSNATVWTWGDNSLGQLGDNTTTQRNTPVQVVGTGGTGTLTGVTAITAGIFHTVALKSDGTVWAWGYNGNGQFGDNSATSRRTPVAITINTGNTVAIASGTYSYHTAILRSELNTVFLTGYNDNGQHGNSTTTSSNTYGSITCGSFLGTPTATTTFSNQVLPAAGIAFNLQSACYLAASLTPNGASPASGDLAAKLWVDASEPTTATSLYTRRHYQITPANASTATGRITIYATQQEFTTYNNISTTDLPASPSDAAGIGRLRIYKYSGNSSNTTGLPATYTGSPVIINPVDADITWNSTNNYWQISFDVTGFSGFFIGAADAVILPIKLAGFTAAKQGNSSALTWKVTGEENIATYTIERSADGRSFTTVGSVASLGNTTSARSYSFTDANVLKGANYYRLKITEKDGKVNYSEVRLLNFGSQISIALYPNPAKDKATLTGVEAGNSIRLVDAVGKVLQVQKATSTTETIIISHLKGFYSVQVYGTNGTLLSTTRMIK